MNCDKAIDLLPGYAVGALSENESAQLEQHLSGGRRSEGHQRDGCRSCREELDELTAAACLLAESVTPTSLRPQVKLELFDRIENEKVQPKSDSYSSSPGKSRLAERRWRRALPAIAATLFAVAVGSWVARYGDQTASNDFGDQPIGNSTEVDQWQRRIAATEQALGSPRIQLAKLESDAKGDGLRAAVFHDRLSGELHVLAATTIPPSPDRQLWLWLTDHQGGRITQGPLESLGDGHAAGVFELFAATGDVRTVELKLVITDQPNGNATEPVGPVVGQGRLSMRL